MCFCFASLDGESIFTYLHTSYKLTRLRSNLQTTLPQQNKDMTQTQRIVQIKQSSVSHKKTKRWKRIMSIKPSRCTMQKQPPKLLCKKRCSYILQIWQENICARVFFQQICVPSYLQLYLKKTPIQVFFSKIDEILQNIYFEKHLQTAASSFQTLISISSTLLHELLRFYE